MSTKKKKKLNVAEDDVIVLDHVTKSYDNTDALEDVSLTIKKGEFVFIVGGSGSGKTTLIKLLLREIEATQGQVYVLGYDLNRIRHRRIPEFRRKIGVVFQDFRLIKEYNVFENVAFAQRVVHTPAKEIRKNVIRVLKQVNLPGKYKMKPKSLAGGEQQRVAIARALVNEPSLLLCDEPTGNLDPLNTREIMQLLEQINQSGTTVVVVTHNRDVVNEMCKRVITLQKGVVVSDQEEGTYLDEDI